MNIYYQCCYGHLKRKESGLCSIERELHSAKSKSHFAKSGKNEPHSKLARS